MPAPGPEEHVVPFYRLDSEQLFVADWSEPGGRARNPLLLIHGAAMDRSVWALTGRALAAAHGPVLALDLPGHGRSRGTPRRRIEAYADCVLGLIAAIPLEQPILIGHSMGALVALEAARRHDAAGLVLLGAAAQMPVHPRLLELARSAPGQAAQLMIRWSLPAERRFGAQPVPGAWLPGATRRLILNAGPGVLAADLEACNAYAAGARAAAAIRCPALVIAGTRDRMTPPRAGRALAARIEGGRFMSIEDCGHLMMLEQPRRVVQLIADFLGPRIA